MMVSRPRRNREVIGPGPNSVAIFARPTNKRPPEHLILARRAKDDMIQRAEELTKGNGLCDLRTEWECRTDKKIQRNTVHQRVKGRLQASKFGIEDRQERLRDLLQAEDEGYMEEMAAKEETVLERQAKMRERAKSLKERREKERLQIVQEKLEQQWRDECEELRATMSKRQQDQVAVERLEQLKIQADLEAAKENEEKRYAELWYADMMAKARKEDEQTQRQMTANRDMLDTLNKQMAALEAEKQKERQLKEEEAQLLREQNELRKLEEIRAKEEKRRRQQEACRDYDRSMRMKRDMTAREMQEQLAFDLKILEQLLEESRNEAMENSKRKKELREEGQRYRRYLEQLKAEEKAAAAQLEQLVNAEVEKVWQKKLAQWKLEKEARRTLLNDVLATRRQQVQDKLRRNEQQQAEIARERDELTRSIEEHRRREAEKDALLHNQHLAYQNDLRSQMHYTNSQREQEDVEEERVWKSQRSAEMEYQRKLELALDSPYVEKLHPIRKPHAALSGSHAHRSAAVNF